MFVTSGSGFSQLVGMLELDNSRIKWHWLKVLSDNLKVMFSLVMCRLTYFF